MSIAEKIGKFSYVPSHIQFFKNRGQYFARGKKTPQKGDVIFFGDEAHVGLVESVSGSTVTTIEGNTSGASGLVANGGGVCRKYYGVSSSYICGYGRPSYASGEADKILSVAASQIGYLEKKSNSQLDSFTGNAGSNNYTKYARDIWPSLQAQPWCDIFVSWCAIQADKSGSSSAFSETTVEKKIDVVFKPWKDYKNGSTPEPVYRDSDLTEAIGSLDPNERCYCAGVYGKAYLVIYKLEGYDDRYAVGYVGYSGGVKV